MSSARRDVAAGERARLTLRVNGECHEVLVAPHKTLLEVLREELALTGTKHGCELGECGACTVLIDGAPVLSCLTLPLEIEGCAIETIEGLAVDGRPHALQTAFAELGASQCGYCSPGMLMSAKALLDEVSQPGEGEIRAHLAGNLCRCTGYLQIIEAVQRAANESAAGVGRRSGDADAGGVAAE
jgi:carbon-monoxide dehydrogenase small subunit